LGSPQAIQSLFIGGGTPTYLSIEQWEVLFQHLQAWLHLEESGEWSVEANPNDLTEEYCRSLRQGGIRRISLGGQSFDDRKLVRLERRHTGDQLRRAMELALRHFESVSLDLIFAVPGESLSDWQRDLEMATTIGAHHLSTYGLTFDKGSSFWSRRQSGTLQQVDEDTELIMYRHAIDFLRDRGFEHYEVSNFARQGHRCLHNEQYWTDQRWWAFGPGAARFVGGHRTTNHRSTTRYLQKVEAWCSPVVETEVLNDDQLAVDRLVFGCRRLEGVPWSGVLAGLSPACLRRVQQVVQTQVEQGWLEIQSGRLRLTDRGLVVSDELWSDYYAVLDSSGHRAIT
jgi:oxygen-independent coproporphyrinogen-3 oxidase